MINAPSRQHFGEIKKGVSGMNVGKYVCGSLKTSEIECSNRGCGHLQTKEINEESKCKKE